MTSGCPNLGWLRLLGVRRSEGSPVDVGAGLDHIIQCILPCLDLSWAEDSLGAVAAVPPNINVI